MLIYRRTSIMESSAQTLVNTVNCVGVMGKGIAKEFRDRNPEMFASYKNICEKGLLTPGKLWLWQGSENWVLNFPTKIHWKNPSKIEWIEAGLQKFAKTYASRGIKEISFPRLGCGNGGLDWSEVRPMMEHYLAPLSIPIFIHDYTVDIGIPEHLESVADQIKLDAPSLASFDDFISLLRQVAQLSKGSLSDLKDKIEFSARMDDEGTLEIKTNDGGFFSLEPEDLRGVWINLLNGLVTRDRAGWSVKNVADALLTMLSLLPGVRPIQIQRARSDHNELAVELRPSARRTMLAPSGIGDSRHQPAWG